jgi:hypothetical protein
VQQTLLDGLELDDDRLGFVDGGVEGVQDLGNIGFVARWGDTLTGKDQNLRLTAESFMLPGNSMPVA